MEVVICITTSVVKIINTFGIPTYFNSVHPNNVPEFFPFYLSPPLFSASK
jgi:hypothetical protein